MSNDDMRTLALRFSDDGATPNHPRFELLLHRGALKASAGGDSAAAIEALFAANGWGGFWRDGVYPFHHYHSTCHEALGVAHGWAEVRFGGEAGETLRLETGDVAVLPAGTGHKRIDASPDFLVVGAYPADEPYDMIRSDDVAAHEAAVARIAETPVPATDPVFGPAGGLRERWGRS
ncbi:cupin [Chenggangzhangella methanolivorans]|uniref:cupin n=1 Tax=Chenggangzhangella methanolivorans TaxID=1437009 RepID=UPI0036098888